VKDKIHGFPILLYIGLTTTLKWLIWKQILKMKLTWVSIFMLLN